MAENEKLRLRPQKQPAVCPGNEPANCPAIDAPRINRRSSTIPGTSKPDHGRPPVIGNPLGQRAQPQIGIFGNSAIGGK